MVPALVAAAFSVFAFVVLNTGLSTGRVAIVIVLSSLSTAVTVILARVLNRDPMAWHQWVAIASVIAGLSLLRA